MSGLKSKRVKPLSSKERGRFDTLVSGLPDVMAYVNIWHDDVFFGPFVCDDAREIMAWLESRLSSPRGAIFDDWRESWHDRLHDLASTTPDDRITSLGYVLRSRVWAVGDLNALYLAEVAE